MVNINPKYLSIGVRLIELRTTLKLNQTQTSEALKIKARTYQNYEYGFSKPNTENLKKIIDFYKCDYNWLLTGEGMSYPDNQEGAPTPQLNQPEVMLSDDLLYITPAVRILNEAIADAKVELNVAQRNALVKVIQDELENAETKASNKAKEIINVFKKDG